MTDLLQEAWLHHWHNGELRVATVSGRLVCVVPDGDASIARAIAAFPFALRVLKDVERVASELGAKGYPLNAMRDAIAASEGVL